MNQVFSFSASTASAAPRRRASFLPTLLLTGMFALAASPAWGATNYHYGAGAETSFDAFVLSEGLTSVMTGILDFSSVTTSPATVFTDVASAGVDFYGFNNTGNTPSNMTIGINEELIGANAGNVEIFLPVGTLAFGMHITSNTNGSYVFIYNSGGNSAPIGFSMNQTRFIGVTNSAGLNSFIIDPVGMTVTINDFELNGAVTVSETPEPGTMALMGGALILFPLLTRRRKQNSVP